MAQYWHGLLAKPACEQCPLRGSIQVFPDGLVPAPLALVAESPGKNEVREGKGLVGATGQIVWWLCAQAGFTREQIWTSNSFLCLPRNVTLTSSAIIPEEKVRRWAAQCCRQRLIQEMLIVQPRVIVAVGALALWALGDLKSPSIFAYRGSRIDMDLENLLWKIQNGLARPALKELESR